MDDDLKIIFFGNSLFSVSVLEALEASDFLPALVVTTKDMPRGRGLALFPTPVKEWAQERGLPVLEVDLFDESTFSILKNYFPDLFVIASYGKIIPEKFLALPRRGSLNVHPSLLPKYRGPTPIPSQILADDKEVGVSIMLIDEKVDHGPILAQEEVPISPWPPRASFLKEVLGETGGELLSRVIPGWIKGDIRTKEQDHEKATFTKKIEKSDGKVDLSEDGYANFLKFCAYDDSVGTHFFANKKGKRIRVKIIDTEFKNGVFSPLRVVPEGGKEMLYGDFLRGLS